VVVEDTVGLAPAAVEGKSKTPMLAQTMVQIPITGYRARPRAGGNL
jgi:hypothetical protein